MKRTALLLTLVFSLATYAQASFNDQFCEALKTLTKNVKKGKIEEVPHTDTTYKMESFLGNSSNHVNTNFEFTEGFPLFQVDYGNPMAGQKILVDKFKVLVNLGYIKTEDTETQNQVKEFVSSIENTISECDCEAKAENKPLETVQASEYFTLEWDCKKQGEITLIVDTLDLGEGVSQFSCYLSFSYIGLK